MPGIAHHGLRRRAGGASDVIASAESPSCATASTIRACPSHVLAVAVRAYLTNCLRN